MHVGAGVPRQAGERRASQSRLTTGASATCPFLARRLHALVSRSWSVQLGRCSTWSWSARRGSMEQALYADVLINVRPMNSLTRSDETKVCPLRRCGFGQPPGPSQRHTDDTPVDQVGDDLVLCHANPLNPRIAAEANRSAHATSSG
jgi:hypothetical protein